MLEFQKRAGIYHAPQRSARHTRRAGAWSRISPVAVIYGDNAAGKSNLLKCMNFFSNFVRNSFALREGINTQLFLLDRESAK
ncbi:AAA family ATPase [Bifidobacterium breve]|uniref:AAA family ATPase n=1 Tax=Bifidobacterium breve TaxID=1685 RepID=UPI001F4CEA06|nr:AAA family ATPase [Bifidobacterium breve]